MRVLVVDDQVHIRDLIRLYVEEAGMICLTAGSGEEAIKRVVEDDPDVVLMDVVMPGMDGMETTRQIKALSTVHRPVIFMTGLSEGEALSQCLECGGDDFVNKDVDPVTLAARIRAHGRTRALALQAEKQRAELARLNQDMQAEMELARHVVERIVEPCDRDIPGVTCYSRSMTGFNGDLVLSVRRPLGGWYVLVGDFTGHGLPASVGAFPASKVFFAMTAKQFPAGDIAREINRALVDALPDFMFCAAALVEMLEDGRTVRIWHGGLPDALLRHAKGEVEPLSSRHMALGILPGRKFDAAVEERVLQPGDQLLVMTDGLIESRHDEKGMYGEARLLESVSRADAPLTLDHVLDDWRAFAGDEEAQDDVSMALMTVTEALESAPARLPEQALIPWEMRYSWTAEAIRARPDPVSDMVDQIPLPWAFSVHKGNIKVILNELFSNALEHGLLELDSALKQAEDGMIEYYRLREERLSALPRGKVSVRLALVQTEGAPAVQIQVTDTGRGFDTRPVEDRLTRHTEDSEAAFGRGLMLVASLCRRVHFADNGRTVKVLYPLM
ncbi:MAG: response regulator [Gammaproteobacteria bacterium]|nr:MAG: response regulator [Gammaproteobacteria bacterium]